MNELTSGGTLTAEENAFFETGGEAPIPADTGSDPAGGTTNDNGSGNPDGGTNSAEPGKTGGEPKNVPHAALHEERMRRKELSTKLQTVEQQLAEMRGKFSIIERLNAKPAGGEGEAPAGPPALEEDVFGHVKHVGETVEQIKKRLDDADAAAKAKTETDAAEHTFVSNYRNDAAAFETKTPDFKAAYNFLLATRAQELIAIGFDDPNAVAQAGGDEAAVHAARKALHDALMADERGIAELAFSKKKSPAETIYGLAKQRGYAPKAAGDGGKTKGAETLDNIERGQAAHKSLNDTGSGGGEDAMTAERLIAMPLAEFEAWSEKHPALARRLMGG